MGIYLKKVLSQLRKLIEITPDQLEYSSVKEDSDVSTTGNKLENYFRSRNLEHGDRLRIIDTSGSLYDIILLANDKVAIQNIILKVEYGSVTVHSDWEKAEKAIPGEYSIQQLIVATRR